MKAHREIDWHRLVRYVTKECTPEEARELDAWVAEDEERTELCSNLQSVWQLSARPIPARDAVAAWENVSEKLETSSSAIDRRESALTVGGRRASGRGGRRPSRTRRGRLSYLAGSLVLAMVVALAAVFFVDESPLMPGTTQTFETRKGQLATVKLADGTRVRLSVDSRLSFPEAFGEDHRAVRLDGEAYFDVAHDSTRPFIVHTTGASINVLGTAFNVQAYRDEEKTQVAVARGSVSLRPARATPRDTVVLKPHQLGLVAGRNLQTIRRGVNLSDELAWTEGRLVFRDSPLDEVIRRLERWYDLRIEARVPVDSVDRLNAAFDDESANEALEATTRVLNLRFIRERGVIALYQ